MAEVVRFHTVRLRDGRVLAVEDRGPIDSPAVIAHHGTPSCRLDVPSGPATVDRIGVRVITFDRPGYGVSTNLPGRSVSDAAANAQAIADALDIERFATVGVSGGGPHALATAARLPDRVSKVCVSVGLGPVEHPDFDARAGMPLETLEEIDAAQAGPEVLRAYVERHSNPSTGLDPWIEQLPPSDQEVLARPSVRAVEEAVALEWQRASIEGWVEDSLAFFTRPWGFGVPDVPQPTLLLYGEADVLVPLAHGRALSRLIPESHLLTIPNGGHWLLDYEADALRWLVDRTNPPGAAYPSSELFEVRG
jgi:pimeloyl-ACP methyl ester carboxylesterase